MSLLWTVRSARQNRFRKICSHWKHISIYATWKRLIQAVVCVCDAVCTCVCRFVRMSGCAALHVSASLYTLCQHIMLQRPTMQQSASEERGKEQRGGGEETGQNLDFLLRGCSVVNLHSHRRAPLQMHHTGLKSNTHPRAKLNVLSISKAVQKKNEYLMNTVHYTVWKIESETVSILQRKNLFAKLYAILLSHSIVGAIVRIMNCIPLNLVAN